MKRYIILFLFFLNFAFVFHQGKIEVVTGVEAKAQRPGYELGEVEISVCGYCGQPGCQTSNHICNFCGTLGCNGACQTCPCCTVPYCLGLHCNSDCEEGYCTYCGVCGDNGKCVNLCLDGTLPCPICGQCGCEGECQVPDDPKDPNACNESDSAANDLLQAFLDYQTAVENYQTNIDLLNQRTNDYLSAYNDYDGLIDEKMSQYQNAITEYENNVTDYQNMINDFSNSVNYANDSKQKLTAAEFEYSVTGSISSDPLSYYTATMNNFSSYLTSQSDYNLNLNNIKYSVDGIKSYNDRTQYKDSVTAYNNLLTSNLIANQAFADSVSLLHQHLFGTQNSGTALTVQQKYDHLMLFKNTMQSFVTFVDSKVNVVRQTTPDYLKNITDNQEYMKKAMLDREEIRVKATEQYNLLFGDYSVSASFTTDETKALQWVSSYAQNRQFADYYSAKCRYIAQTQTSVFNPYVSYFAGQLTKQLASYAGIKGTWNNYVSGKFLSYLGKSSESELSGAKDFYVELDNLVKQYEPDTTIAYNTRLYRVLNYYNPTDVNKQELKYYVYNKLADEQSVALGMEQIKQQGDKVKNSEDKAKNYENMLTAQQQGMFQTLSTNYRNARDMYDLTKNMYDQNIKSSLNRLNQAIQRFNDIKTSCPNAQTPSTNVTNTNAPDNKLKGKTPPKSIEQSSLEALGKSLAIYGLNAEATKLLLKSLTELGGTLGIGSKELLSFTYGAARLSGYVQVAGAIIKFGSEPTSANFINLVVNCALVSAGFEINVFVGILDMLGVTDQLYNYVGKPIDQNVIEPTINNLDYKYQQSSYWYYNFLKDVENKINPSFWFNY